MLTPPRRLAPPRPAYCSALAALAVVLPLALSACDPCFGVLSCETRPRIAIEGELVRHADGVPEPGVVVDFVRTSGAGLDRDSIRTITDSAGRFAIEAWAAEPGTVVADIVVAPQSGPAYRVEDLRFTTTSLRGQGYVLDRWVTERYYAYHGELFREATGDFVEGARVEFRRTAGPAVDGPNWVDGVYTAISDAAGRFTLFHGVSPLGSGVLVGDITVYPPGSDRSYIFTGIALNSTHVANAVIEIIQLGL